MRQYLASLSILVALPLFALEPKDARAEYDRLGGRRVPLILVGSQRMQGFRAESFDRLLRSAGR